MVVKSTTIFAHQSVLRVLSCRILDGRRSAERLLDWNVFVSEWPTAEISRFVTSRSRRCRQHSCCKCTSWCQCCLFCVVVL